MSLWCAAFLPPPKGHPIGCCRIVVQTLPSNVPGIVFGVMIPFKSRVNGSGASAFVNPPAIIFLVEQYSIGVVLFEILSQVEWNHTFMSLVLREVSLLPTKAIVD